MGEIIFTPLLGVLLHRGSHGWRRHRKHLTNHPLGTRPNIRKSHEINIFVADFFKQMNDHFRCKIDLKTFGHIFVTGPRGDNITKSLFLYFFRKFAPTSIFVFVATSRNRFALLQYHFPPFVVRIIQKVTICFFRNTQLTALCTYTFQDIIHGIQILNVKYGFG